jgi:hypothetical protein
MNSLLTHSNLSFESFEPSQQRPPSIISFATDTSTYTVQGIGTLSGRLIYSFGDVALRGIENLAIRRRLGKATKAFPHKDDEATREIETAYDHTLELSRYLFNLVLITMEYQVQFHYAGSASIMLEFESRRCEYCLSRLQPGKLVTF